MRGLARSRMRSGLDLIAFCMLGAACILIANALIVGTTAFVLILTDANDVGPAASEVSQALTEQDGAHVLPADMVQDLRAYGCWALLIDESGSVAWGLDVPDDVPTSYTPADVASFTRWYLNDYPVSCWQHGEGLVVVGSPKGSAWKYSLTSSFETLGDSVLLAVMIFLADLIVLIALTRLYARRSWKQRDDARNEWVAAVSHDVRTPLAAVVTDAANLAESPRLSAGERERAERVVAKSRETAALLADLNTVNRLRYAMEPVDACDVHLAAVARSVVASYLDGETGGCELELDVAPEAEGVCVRGNEALLKRMVSNLVGNSVRHNPQGCHVKVSLDVRAGLLGTSLGRRLVLVVSDDGCGLGADALAALRKRPGTELPEHGLGLVIVRRIAATHDGKVHFSDNDGGGYRCTVTLPISEVELN